MTTVRTAFAWEARSSEALSRWAAEGTVAVLPVAAIEQHGPHLPLGVDSYIMEGLLTNLCERAGTDRFFAILPVQAIGKSDEHMYAPGTLSLSANLAIKAWTEIGLAVARCGIRKLIIVSSHGGNSDVVGIVARRLRISASMLVGKTHWSYFGFPAGLYGKKEIDTDIHGGDIETSLMLHFHPDLVDLLQARNFENFPYEAGLGRMAGYIAPVSIAWIASDLNPQGVVGNAADATAEKGAQIAAHQVDGMLQALREMRDMVPPHPV
jgi:creatinine amidohydrolase